MPVLAWVFPLPVQELSYDVGLCIANENSVRIHHWNDDEFDVLPQLCRDLVRRNEKVDKTLDDVGGRRVPGGRSTHETDGRLHGIRHLDKAGKIN